MALIVKNGTVVTPDGVATTDILCENGKIAALGNIDQDRSDTVLDATGKFVLPGGIETHTHFDLEVMGMRTADDFLSGSKAALHGGTTTFLDFATQFRGETMKEGLANWHQRAKDGVYTDYGFHMALTEWNEALSDEMSAMIEAGITSFKLYQAYKGSLMVDDGEMLRALQRAAELGVTIGVHCENGDVIDVLVEQARQRGDVTPEFHERCRPPQLEAEAVNRFITLAELAGARHYVVHLSTGTGLDQVRWMRQHGARTVIETCPQYLFLDKACYERGDFYTKAGCVMSPPLRVAKDRQALWQGLADGTIDFVGTDHCSFKLYGQKDHGKDGFWNIPNGAPGVELRMNLLYSGGVASGLFSLNRLAELTSGNAARYFGLYPDKGAIEVDADADFCLIDPHAHWTVTHDMLHDRADYTPYEGQKMQGRISDVILGGQILIRDGEMIDDVPRGRYVKRGLPEYLD